MIDAVDTFYKHVKERMATINPARVMGGYMDAQDWPPNPITFDTLYLLQVADDTASKESWSQAVQIYEMNLQWQWITKGTDVTSTADVMGKNRGDRVRTSFQIMEEIRKAMFPGYTTKNSYAVDAGGTVNATALNEPIMWNRPQFRVRVDKESGLSYGIAIVKLINMTELIES